MNSSQRFRIHYLVLCGLNSGYGCESKWCPKGYQKHSTTSYFQTVELSQTVPASRIFVSRCPQMPSDKTQLRASVLSACFERTLDGASVVSASLAWELGAGTWLLKPTSWKETGNQEIIWKFGKGAEEVVLHHFEFQRDPVGHSWIVCPLKAAKCRPFSNDAMAKGPPKKLPNSSATTFSWIPTGRSHGRGRIHHLRLRKAALRVTTLRLLARITPCDLDESVEFLCIYNMWYMYV